jgi:hypothetical protein
MEILEYKGVISWILSKNKVEKEMGKKLSNEEFDLFCQHFHNNFLAQFDDTLSWQVDDWDEVKDWKL